MNSGEQGFHYIVSGDAPVMIYGKKYHSNNFLLKLDNNYYISNHSWMDASIPSDFTIIKINPEKTIIKEQPALYRPNDTDVRALHEAYKILKLEKFKKQMDGL